VHGIARRDGRPERGVVVWIDAPDAPRERRGRTPVLAQRNLQFSPQVLAVQVGSVVEFPNMDRVFHNVFSFHDGKRFDLGLYPTGVVRRITFDHPGLSHIFCNIHPQMAAYVMAVPTPYFAVSDAAGQFSIDGVPCGPHEYEAWRAGAPTMARQPITVEPNTFLDVRWP
jgi:plastocyanin